MGIILLYINLIISLSRLKIFEMKYELRSVFSTLLIYNTTTLSWTDYGLIKLILIYDGRTVNNFIVNRKLLSQRKSPQRNFKKSSRKILRYTLFIVILRKYREDHAIKIILLFILLE